MKIFHNIYLAFLVLIFSVLVFSFAVFQNQLGEVSSDDTKQVVVIEQGSITSIAENLYDKHLIKNKLAFKFYVRMTGKTSLKAATYSLSENMGTKKIVDILYAGEGSNSEEVKITFKEGLNMRKLALVIVENTNHTEEEVLRIASDQEYLSSLISKYWFLNEAILDEDIYYPLEGYLYPNTYHLSSKEVTVEEILEMMLDEMEKQLEPVKASIQASEFSVHELLTLASMVELEGVTAADRKGIAGVFVNRLTAKMTLGSDVTTYYGAKVDMGERDLLKEEVTACNSYNTRCATFVGLPVSPICNPSLESIEAVLDPEETKYYYFVADKNKKVYFSKNITEHNKMIASLKTQGLWYEY